MCDGEGARAFEKECAAHRKKFWRLMKQYTGIIAPDILRMSRSRITWFIRSSVNSVQILPPNTHNGRRS